MKTKPQILEVILLALIFITISSVDLFAQRRSSQPILMPKQPPFLPYKTPNDTLFPGNLLPLLLDTTVISDYVMLTSDNGGYILGTNGWNDKCKCQEFKVSSNYHIEGAIYWFGFKTDSTKGLVKFSIWDMDGTTGTTADTNNQPCPGTLTVSIADTTTRIDTSSILNQAYVAMFPFPVLVNSNYCIGFDMSQIGGDSIALVSTNKGQGGNLELVWEQWSSNNNWYTLQGAQWDSGTVDVDAMILPIIDNTAGCVENGDFISGMKLSQSFPNPTDDECTISYEFLTPPASTGIEILDMNGRRVYFNENIAACKGINQMSIDVSGFKNGTYFYILSTPESRMAKRMVISR
jgi:hypothetical protein